MPARKKELTGKEKLACLRTAANFGASRVPNNFIIDGKNFNLEAVKKGIWEYMPKAKTLIETIEHLDKQDNKLHKHVVYTDVQERGLGTKALASAFIAAGWSLCRYTKTGAGRDAVYGLERKPGNKTFTFLSSSSVKGPNVFAKGPNLSVPDNPPSVQVRNKIGAAVKDIFNARPDNIYGEQCRVLLLDSGFKEGVDVFDVKYIHLLEPPLSQASLIQAIGRGVRRCGQVGLPYGEKGWNVDIYIYRSLELKRENDKRSVGPPVFRLQVEADPDSKNSELVNRLLNYSIESAVDYDLNRNITMYIAPGSEDAIKEAQLKLGIP